MTNISYDYMKLRKNMGRQPFFCEAQTQLLDSILPSTALQRQYILRNPVNSASQAAINFSKHTANTPEVVLTEAGVNHAEGGWPKEVNFFDEEATTRYRRRFERDDSYIHTVLSQYHKMDYYIKQNNGIEMYQMYFKGMQPQVPVEKMNIAVKNVYKDPLHRPIASVDWTWEDNPKVVVSYCDKRYPYHLPKPINTVIEGYIWDLEDPNYPASTFSPPTACWQAVCSPTSPTMIIAGLADGRVCIFDMRTSIVPVQISEAHLAHRDPVSAVVFMHSRSNTEFFSGSSDGSCMWWDIRDLRLPTDLLIMSVRIPPGHDVSKANAEGVTSLQFEKIFPTRFLCGTETGYIMNINRKGKTRQEMFSSVIYAHQGPVNVIQRSPFVSKMLITCGDWSVHIWSDDIHTSPILTGMRQKYKINDVTWAPQRCSSYMMACSDGKFRFWDLLRKFDGPAKILHISDYPLLKMKCHDFGQLVAVGDQNGAMILVGLSESMAVSRSNDKQLIVQAYERETKREHIIETRLKEIKLKLKGDEGTATTTEGDEDAQVRMAEDVYRKHVSELIRSMGITNTGAGDRSKMRKR